MAEIHQLRDVWRWKKPVAFFETLDAFMARESLPAGITSIKFGRTILDFLYTDRESDTLIVNFHPALATRKDIKLPIFVGQNVSGQQADCLFVSDPGLYSGSRITLAWFAGMETCPFQQLFPSLLERMLELRGRPRHLIFFGISGGGFAAAYYATFFPGSIAVAINPQTKIWKFGEPAVKEYLRACFGAENEPFESALRSRIQADLCEVYSHPVQNTLLYLQNATDHHVEQHAQPFFEELALENVPQVHYYEGLDWGEGHVGPKPELMSGILSQLIGAQGDWRACLPLRFEGLRSRIAP